MLGSETRALPIMGDMHNRVVLITGASSGIGAALARRLAGTSRLALVARRADRLQALAAEIGELGGEAACFPTDLAEPGAASGVVGRVVAELGCLNAVVNNAGIFQTAASGAIDQAHLQVQLELNLVAPILLTEAAVPHIAAEGGGWVINISSVAAEAGFPGCGVYGASKAGLEAWSRSLREEVRDRHIRVGLVVPGATDTEVWGTDCSYDRSKMARSDDVARSIQHLLDAPPSASIDRIVITPPGGAL